MNDTEKNLGEIIFYCKDCQEIVDTEKIGKKYVYKCNKCGTKNVAFGTRKSIYGYFRLEEGALSRRKDEEQIEDEKVITGSIS